MDFADIRAFAARDWDALERHKARAWTELKRSMSAAEVLALADELRRHTREIRPDWPNADDREADRAVHRRVGEALRACSRRGPR